MFQTRRRLRQHFERHSPPWGGWTVSFVNAGITSRASSFPEMTSEMYHELLAVNLHGAFYTLRAAARHMRDRALAGEPGGSIVICGSLSIIHGLEGMEHYAGAKGALAAMVKSLAVE